MFRTIVVASLLVATPAMAEDLLPAVRRHVVQLGSDTAPEANAAEAALLKMGPAILETLKSPAIKPFEEGVPAIKHRLSRIRKQLESQHSEDAAAATSITIDANKMPISQLLAALSKQSGNAIIDHRRAFGQVVTDREVSVKFDKTPFWQALDQALDAAGMTVYDFAGQRQIAVVDRDESELARSVGASYSGPFRFEAASLIASRQLRRKSGTLQVTLNIAWEPRLTPIALSQKLSLIEATTPDGKPLKVKQPDAELEVPVGPGKTTTQLLIPLELPSRKVSQIASLRGTLHALLPGKMAKFRFDKLAKARRVEKREGEVRVMLDQVRRNRQVWEVHVLVAFEKANEALQSHRGWIFQNRAYLLDAKGNTVKHIGFETTRQTANEVGLAYFFAAEGGLDGYNFVYETPAVLIKKPVRFELKNLPLP